MSVKRQLLTVLLGGALVLASLNACGKKEEVPEETVSVSENAEPETPAPKTKEEMLEMVTVKTIADEDCLRLRKTYFGTKFHPQSMEWPELYVACYEGLYTSVQQNGYTYYKTAGAESNEVSEDGLTVTFYLRRDAKWSDGVSVTAGDYEYAWKYLLDPDHNLNWDILSNVQGAAAFHEGSGSVEEVGIHALDAYTLQVTLNQPDAAFARKTISPYLYPLRQSVVDAANEKGRWGDDWKDCVFNGPYVIEDYGKVQYVKLARNDYYWDQVDVTAEHVIWYLETNDDMAMTMLKEGKLDALQLYTADSGELDAQVASGQMNAMMANLPGLSYLTFRYDGGTSGAMQVGKVRQALSLAIDREALCERFGQLPAYGLVPTPYNVGSVAFRIRTEEPLRADYEEYQRSPEKLKKLIATGLKEKKSAMKTAEEISLTLLTYETDEKTLAILSAIAANWEEVLGIHTEILVPENYKQFKEYRDNGAYDLLLTSYSQAYDDIYDYMSFFIAGKNPNNGNSGNDSYKNFVEEARFAGVSEASELYAKAEENLLVENTYVIPLFYHTEVLYVNPEVENLAINPFGANPETAFASYPDRQVTEEEEEKEEEEAPVEEPKKKKLFNGWGK